MQNKTNPSIFYAAALLKKGYDTINPCCQQSTDGDSQHPSGHQTLRNSPTHSRKPLRGPYSDNSSRNGVCRTYRNLQILRQIKRKRTGSFRNHRTPMKTYMANPDKIERKWYVVDAEGATLGRLASEIAKVLRGKNKPEYTPHIDTGDYVIVVNAEKVKVTGKKLQQKIYYNHSDYVGGMKETTLAELLAKKPEKVIELAVKGMLPKGPMGRDMIKKLHVYAGPEHANQAQKPEVLTF